MLLETLQHMIQEYGYGDEFILKLVGSRTEHSIQELYKMYDYIGETFGRCEHNFQVFKILARYCIDGDCGNKALYYFDKYTVATPEEIIKFVSMRDGIEWKILREYILTYSINVNVLDLRSIPYNNTFGLDFVKFLQEQGHTFKHCDYLYDILEDTNENDSIQILDILVQYHDIHKMYNDCIILDFIHNVNAVKYLATVLGYEVNAIVDDAGNTVLHHLLDSMSERWNCLGLLLVLIDLGASVDIKNKAGSSVRDIISKNWAVQMYIKIN